MPRTAQRGFTLIEVMVVIVIVGIIASIALTGYQSYLRRSACEDAKASVVGVATLLERYRAQNNTYVGFAVPASINQQSATITLPTQTVSTYTVTGTGNGTLVGLGTLTLTQAGVRGGAGNLGGRWASCAGI